MEGRIGPCPVLSLFLSLVAHRSPLNNKKRKKKKTEKYIDDHENKVRLKFQPYSLAKTVGTLPSISISVLLFLTHASIPLRPFSTPTPLRRLAKFLSVSTIGTSI